LLAKIESLKSPDPLDAEVLEQGRNFSGGEKQRLALARVFLSKAQLLVLDEPTAALDTENQALVQGAIFELTRDRSALIVAHRLNTLQQADRIIVLDKGSVVQMGSYAELEQVPGMFRSLIEKERIETKPTRSEIALA
jgi:ABC-type multidrug transport system fused ATPase/permease subunit